MPRISRLLPSCSIRLLILTAMHAVMALGQTTPQSLLVTRIYNITSSWAGECGPGVIDNRSIYTRQNNFHSIYASGSGTWTVSMSYSDVSCSGPWTSFGAPQQITQSSTWPVATAIGYHPFIQITVTGSASAIYAAAKDFFPGVMEGGISLPPGGAAGSVLTKNSSADYDVSWTPVSIGQLTLPPVPNGIYCLSVSGNQIAGLVSCSGGGGSVSWSGLTSGQWSGLTSGQWASLTN
jgi:hypothetical protein